MGRLGSFRPGAGAAHGLGQRGDGLFLADDARVQRVFHLQQALALLAGDAHQRDAGPHRDDLGDVLFGDEGLLVGALLGLAARFHLADALAQAALALAAAPAARL